MTKPSRLSIQFKVPKGTKNAKISIDEAGDMTFVDALGNQIIPTFMERTVHYARKKGPKVQSRQMISGRLASVGGLTEFSKYDSVFVTDTNTRTIGGKRISATCVICCRFHPEGAKVRVESQGRLNIYEFHEVPGKPEMLAILKVTRDVSRDIGSLAGLRFAFVTDSELSAHDDITSRRRPIYGKHYLPEEFSLHYASSDTGQEAINRLIRFCDKQAGSYLQVLEKGALLEPPLQTLEEDPRVSFRYVYVEGLEVVNPVVGGISIQPGSTVSLYGIKDENDQNTESAE